MQNKVIKAVEQLLPKLPGWCSVSKAKKMIRFIMSENASCCVELGVFGGSSLIPQAMALQAMSLGRVHGIDPYSVVEAIRSTPNGANSDWWQSVDLQKIKRDLVSLINRMSLSEYVTLHETTSDSAVSKFTDNSVDQLHIDGNHSTEQSLRDVQQWLPKLKSTGILLIDDISWGFERLSVSTTGPAIDLALQHCTWMGVVDQCLICRKR